MYGRFPALALTVNRLARGAIVMYDRFMDTSRSHSHVTAWVVYVPGVATVRTYATYSDAWRASEAVLASTGRVALVEPLAG